MRAMAADALREPPARRGPSRLAWVAYAVALVAIVADQLSKWWVLGVLDLPSRGRILVLPPVFDLTLVHNAGVSFGLLRGGDVGRWLLTLFSLVVALALAWWARRVDKPLTAFAIGLVMGGAIGNAVDRLRVGVVTDFLDFSGLHFPWVFNVADSCITVGVVLLVIESLLAPKPGAGGGVAAKKP